MSYDYQTQRAEVFTERGQIMFLKIRDHTRRLLDISGAARLQEMIATTSGDSWTMLACVDRLVELGELKEITAGMCFAGQHRVFVEVFR